MHDDELRLCVVQHVVHLAAGVAGIDRNHNGTESRKREPCQWKLGYVRQHHADMRALADADALQPARELIDLALQLPVSERTAALEEIPCEAIWRRLADLIDQCPDVARQRLGFDLPSALLIGWHANGKNLWTAHADNPLLSYFGLTATRTASATSSGGSQRT